jgi:hypothetical protein
MTSLGGLQHVYSYILRGGVAQLSKVVFEHFYYLFTHRFPYLLKGPRLFRSDSKLDLQFESLERLMSEFAALLCRERGSDGCPSSLFRPSARSQASTCSLDLLLLLLLVLFLFLFFFLSFSSPPSPTIFKTAAAATMVDQGK